MRCHYWHRESMSSMLCEIFDSQLSMSAQISVVCRTGYYQLRQLRPLVRCLSEDAAKILIQAFINTRLYYCNSLYFVIADGLMSRLQSDQNAACMSHHRRQAVRAHHASPMLVRRRVNFKTSILKHAFYASRIFILLIQKNKLMSLRKVKVR